MSKDCIFCKIASGEILSDKIAENSDAFAFRDLNPQAPTHVLVIPKNHIEKLGQAGPFLGSIYELIHETAESEGLLDNGYRVIVNQGKDGGQEVPHLHFHVLGGRALTWPPG